MSDGPTASWPEHPGVDTWIPVHAADGLANELGAVLIEDMTNAWFRAPGDWAGSPWDGEIRLAWIADGHLHLAVVADGWPSSRPTPIRIVSHRQIHLDSLPTSLDNGSGLPPTARRRDPGSHTAVRPS